MTLYRWALAILVVGVFFTNLPNFVAVNVGGLVPYQWVLAFAALAAPVVVRQLATVDIARSPIVAWAAFYVWVTIVWFIASSQSEIGWQEIRWRIMTVLQLGMFVILLTDHHVKEKIRHLLVWGVLLGVALNVYEVFVPLSFSTILGRSAGLYMNATTSAFALVGGMILAATVLPSAYRGVFVLVVGVGVVCTFSRGGIIAWGVAAAGFLVMKELDARGFVRGLLVGVVVLAGLLVPRWDALLTTLDQAGVVNANVEERLLWLTDPSGVQDQSSWSRGYVAQRLWDRWAEHPFLGNGTGAAFSAFEIPPHNQYLVFMVDHGMVGCVLFPALILLVMFGHGGARNAPAILFGCSQAFAGLVSHTLLNEPQTLLLFALAAAPPAAADARRTGEAWMMRGERSQAVPMRSYA
jgi:hypothetical protein